MERSHTPSYYWRRQFVNPVKCRVGRLRKVSDKVSDAVNRMNERYGEIVATAAIMMVMKKVIIFQA